MNTFLLNITCHMHFVVYLKSLNNNIIFYTRKKFHKICMWKLTRIDVKYTQSHLQGDKEY